MSLLRTMRCVGCWRIEFFLIRREVKWVKFPMGENNFAGGNFIV
jgi:hypothetical protein